jgi:hypothetical protein
MSTAPLFEAEDTTEVPTPEDTRYTEAHLLRLLRARYERDGGNGSRYVFATHVRNRASFDASRTFDAVAVDLWRSSGLLVHVFEVKVSRGDWLRELSDLDKSAAAIDRGDTFTVVAPAGIVRMDELPDGWGLFESPRPGLLTTRRAPRVHRTREHSRAIYPDMPRDFVVPLLRAAVRTARDGATSTTPEETT